MPPDHAPTTPDTGRSTPQDGAGSRRSRVGGWPLFTALVVVAVILYAVRYILLPFIIAIGIAFVLEPLIQWLQRRTGMKRGLIATAFYIVLLALFAAGFYWLGKTIVRDVSALVANGPDLIRSLLTGLLGPSGINVGGQLLTPDALAKQALDGLGTFITAGLAAQFAGTGIAALLGLVLTLVLIPYFLLSGPEIAESTLWLVPPERRESVRSVLPRMVPMLRHYLVGVACVVAYTAIAAYIGFGLIFHLPHAVLLSLAVGILEIIPSLGPTASFVLVGLAAVENEHSFGAAALLGAYAVALRLSIDNVVGPIVLGRAVNVPRVVILFAFVCGGVLFGIIGLVLAVPAAACTKIVLEAYYSEPIGRNGDAFGRPPVAARDSA